MSIRSLGTLTLDLLLKLGGFTSGMDQASRVADKRMREIEKRAYAFGHTIGESIKSAALEFVAFTGVTLTVGKALESLKGAIDNADHLRDLSIRLGTSTETLSAFAYAAKQTGTDMDSLAIGLKKLSKNAVDATNPASQQAKIFAALGISVQDASGKVKDLSVLVPELADKISQMKDGTEKAALELALFGKSGTDLTEFLNAGAKGLSDYAARAAELGIVIDTNTANAADRFNDTLSDLHSAFDGLSTQIIADLLPDLQQLLGSLVEMVKQGDKAGSTAHDIAEGFRVVGSAAASSVTLISGVTEILAGFVQQAEGYYQVIAGILSLDLSKIKTGAGNISGSAGKIYAGGDRLINPHGPNGLFPQAPTPSVDSYDFMNGPSNYQAPTASQIALRKAQEKALQAALSGVTDPKDKKSRTGKSDAEREAERVQRAIEQMTKAQQDWEAELSKTGNPIADEYADRLRQVSEEAAGFAKDGVPAEKVKDFTDKMQALAASLRDADIVKFQKEFDDQTAEMAAQMQGPAAEALQKYKEDVAKLDDELKTGAITLTEYNARLALLGQVRDDPMQQVNAGILEQIKLLGMSADQQEIYNNLKQAGVSADSDWGKTIAANTAQLQAQREAMAEQVKVMDAARDAAGTFFDDLNKGEGIWHSLKDAAGQFADTLLRIAQQHLIEQIFGQSGTAGPSGGSGGGYAGFFSSLLSSFFGGGKAGGGTVTPGKFYEVGEYDKPEMLMMRGKQYMIPGNHGNVVPMASSDTRGGGTVNQYFSLSKRNDNRSERQIAQATDRAIRMAR